MHVAVREPSCRAGQATALRSAALKFWGGFGWAEVLRGILLEARATLFESDISPAAWVPERLMMELAEQVYAGPAGGQRQVYEAFVRTMIEHGFGRVRRLLVRYAPPEALLSRAPELWTHDHSHGELKVQVAPRCATAVLRKHPHVTTELSRLTAAETFRCALSLTRAQSVEMSHSHESSELHVQLSWR
jgi:hypothetical protein